MSEKGGKSTPPTQRFLDIAEIRENVVVMKDGTMRAVILVSSINFSLKSDEEQQAVIQGYIQFLNSLEHPLQITIQSRKMNIDGYLDRLKERERSITNELLRSQIRDYTSFIQELVQLGEIMEKRFLVTVPYDPADDGKGGKSFWGKLQHALYPAAIVKLNTKQFNDRRDALMKRTGVIVGGLESMGLSAALLDTQGLIELFYHVYNPELAQSQPLAPIDDLQVEKVMT